MPDKFKSALDALATASAELRDISVNIIQDGKPAELAQSTLAFVRDLDEKRKQVETLQKRVAENKPA